MSQSDGRGTILLTGLEAHNAASFEDIHQELGKQLRINFNVIITTDPDEALRCLLLLRPLVVLVIDAGFHDPPYSTFRAELSKYVKDTGGAVVFCGLYSCFSLFDSINDTFKTLFGLPWTSGSYYNASFVLNSQRTFNHGGLAEKYDMKALQLCHLAPGQAIYLDPDLKGDKTVFYGSQSPIVFTRLENGFVGYAGDVNGEKETTAAILAMCMYVKSEE